MKNYPNLTIAVLLVVTLSLGALQGQRLDRLFEADAFYKWIVAAATNERFNWQEATEHEDPQLYREVVAATESLLGDAVINDAEATPGVSRLGLAVSNHENDSLIYHLAKSGEMDELRASFLDKLRRDRIYYTQTLTYQKVVAGVKEGEGSVSIFNLFFGFRKVAANFIWLQVDRYWHMGQLYKMVPLMKTCVLLDPGFIDAYLLGAWHLGYNATAQMEFTPMPLRNWSDKYQDCIGQKERYYYFAIDFLKDGIRNNPRNYKLFFDLGFAMYREKMNDLKNAILYLTEASRLPHERWVPRMLYKCLEEDGQYEKAMEGWQINLERFPDNEVTLRSMDRLKGLMAEKRSEEALAAAKAATDPAERERLAAEAKAARDEAYEIWSSMDEPFAVGRKLRIEAMDLAEQGRYMEAIAYLDKGRFEAGSLFEEFSDMMIKYKQAGNLPLSLTEKKQLIREEEGVECIGMPAEEKQRRVEALRQKWAS
jgi:tetratricopeptide (TPR) repeat protein